MKVVCIAWILLIILGGTFLCRSHEEEEAKKTRKGLKEGKEKQEAAEQSGLYPL